VARLGIVADAARIETLRTKFAKIAVAFGEAGDGGLPAYALPIPEAFVIREEKCSVALDNRSELRHISQSERDWAHVKSALASGADPEELITQLAHSRANDKSDPQYYARLTVTKALADLQMHKPVSGSSLVLSSEDEREAQH
jgi:hypothetical protein